MKEISLTQGQVALVDDEDYEELAKYKWHAWKSTSGKYYAIRNLTLADRKRTTLKMHRVVLKHTGSEHIDHIDSDQTLNNCKSNLRFVTRFENQANRGPQKNNTSGFKGVSFHKLTGKWSATIKHLNSIFYLGIYETKESAAYIYDAEAYQRFGEFAWLNFPGFIK